MTRGRRAGLAGKVRQAGTGLPRRSGRALPIDTRHSVMLCETFMDLAGQACLQTESHVRVQTIQRALPALCRIIRNKKWYRRIHETT